MTQRRRRSKIIFFFFNDTATTEIYTLSLHDALPIYHLINTVQVIVQAGLFEGDRCLHGKGVCQQHVVLIERGGRAPGQCQHRTEKATAELQSRQYLVFRLFPVKKKHLPLVMSTYDYV